jgi:hypothetical protein
MIVKSMKKNMQIGFQRYGALVNQTLQWTVFTYQVFAAILFMLGIFFANRWLQQPFLGAFYEHTLIFNGTGPGELTPEWALFDQVEVGDQLIAINGTLVKSSSEIQAILQTRVPGENVNVTVRSKSGEERALLITLYPFPSSSRTVYFLIPSILSAIFLATSLWIFGLRRNEPAGRAFSLFTSSLAIVTGAYFNLITTHQFTFFWTMAVIVSAGALIDLALTFPVEPRFAINRPYLRWTGLNIGIILFLTSYTTLFNFDKPTAYIRSWQYIYGFIALSIFFYIGMNLYHAMYAQSPVVKTQSRTILIGTLFAFVPLGAWLLLVSFDLPIFRRTCFCRLHFFPWSLGTPSSDIDFFALMNFYGAG